VPPTLHPDTLQDRFRAAVLGMAVGDALGFPLRGLPPGAAAQAAERVEDFSPRPRGRYQKGQFSAHTQLMLATAESAVASGRVDGRSVASHVAWAPWMSAGAPLGVADPSVLSRALVPGLLSGDDPARLGQEAGVLAVVTHKEPRAAAACAAAARAVALALTGRRWAPEAWCEQVAAAASVHDAGLAEEVRHLPRVLGWDGAKALELMRRVAPASALRGAEGLPAHVTPVLLVAFYGALKAPHDFGSAMRLVLRCGGEVDAASALCGALVAASLGTASVPVKLRRGVAFAGHLEDVADRLFAVAQRGRRAPAVAAQAAVALRR